MRYYVYIILSVPHKSRYVGMTENLSRRLQEHNSGRCRYTKGRMPWKLIYNEKFDTLSEARKREIFLKSGQGRKSLDSFLF